MATIDEVYVQACSNSKQLDSVLKHLEKLNGGVNGLDVRVAVIEEWKRCVGEPTAKDTGDLKVQLAKLAVICGSAGGAYALINALGKCLPMFLGG